MTGLAQLLNCETRTGYTVWGIKLIDGSCAIRPDVEAVHHTASPSRWIGERFLSTPVSGDGCSKYTRTVPAPIQGECWPTSVNGPKGAGTALYHEIAVLTATKAPETTPVAVRISMASFPPEDRSPINGFPDVCPG